MVWLRVSIWADTDCLLLVVSPMSPFPNSPKLWLTTGGMKVGCLFAVSDGARTVVETSEILPKVVALTGCLFFYRLSWEVIVDEHFSLSKAWQMFSLLWNFLSQSCFTILVCCRLMDRLSGRICTLAFWWLMAIISLDGSSLTGYSIESYFLRSLLFLSISARVDF